VGKGGGNQNMSAVIWRKKAEEFINITTKITIITMR
jgi:hypothetical protein